MIPKDAGQGIAQHMLHRYHHKQHQQGHRQPQPPAGALFFPCKVNFVFVAGYGGSVSRGLHRRDDIVIRYLLGVQRYGKAVLHKAYHSLPNGQAAYSFFHPGGAGRAGQSGYVVFSLFHIEIIASNNIRNPQPNTFDTTVPSFFTTFCLHKPCLYIAAKLSFTQNICRGYNVHGGKPTEKAVGFFV